MDVVQSLRVSGTVAPIGWIVRKSEGHVRRHAEIVPETGAGGRDLNRVVRLGQDRPPRCAHVPTDNRQPSCGIDLDQSCSPATRPGGSPPTSPSCRTF